MRGISGRNMLRISSVALIALLGVAGAFAQPAANLPRFEVASVKLNNSESTGSNNDFMSANVTFRNYTLRGVLINAFGLNNEALQAPVWLNDVRVDITGKVPSASATFEQRRQMLQALLFERFGLEVHRESKIRAAFALVTAKNGPKIQAVEDAGGHINDQRDGNIKMLRTTIDNFAETLGHKLSKPVVDETHMQGVYNVTLTYTPDRGESGKLSTDTGPSIFTALEEQLGLMLEARKVPVEMLVVDHCEKVPTGN
jgi:uncharacterized protein (TIGR03435 family)